MNRGTQWLTVLFLGMIVVLLTILVARTTEPVQQAHAQSTGMAGERFLAVTGLKSSGESVLWLVDSKNETVSIYASPTGRAIQYIGTRPIKYEVQVKRPLNDLSRGEFAFDSIKKAWEAGQDDKD